jgi:hypothetical protein
MPELTTIQLAFGIICSVVAVLLIVRRNAADEVKEQESDVWGEIH